MIFLQNKKILNLCFRWHILRSYSFIVEVTFNLPSFVTLSIKNPSNVSLAVQTLSFTTVLIIFLPDLVRK